MKITGKQIEEQKKRAQEAMQMAEELKEFPLDIKKKLVDIIADSPSLVILGDKKYKVKNLRYYSLYRISQLCLKMKEKDGDALDDKKLITALCTDIDAMCEIVAIILCNHLFSPDDIRDYNDANDIMSRNDKWIAIMKAKVMNSTFDTGQWAAIIIGAIESIDLSGFFLLKKSVSMLTDSLLMRKKKSVETASQFMEAQSLRMLPTS